MTNGCQVARIDLWEAANILRGPVDAADFKTYVFPLLFLSGSATSTTRSMRRRSRSPAATRSMRTSPRITASRCRRGATGARCASRHVNVGQALQTAMRDIEKANPETLYGIFGDAQWTNKDRLSDALLRDLIEHFSRFSLGNRPRRRRRPRPGL